jgi:hypothetical protein
MSVLNAFARSLPILLLASTAQAAEIDLTLTSALPGVRSVKVEVVPVESGPRASLAILKPTDVEADGREKVDGLFQPLVDVATGVYRYLLNVALFDGDGRPMESNEGTPEPDDDTLIVDIFIDGDCDDCGDYDFTVPTPTGSSLGSVAGQLQLRGPDGDATWKITTSGNNPDRPAAYAEVEILGSRDPNAPQVLEPFSVVMLDKVTFEFNDDLIFKDGEPAGLPYEIKVAWLDVRGAQIGNTEVFTATATAGKVRRDGTKTYKPWRFHSDVAAVIGETWTLTSESEDHIDASAFGFSLVPLDGGPKFDPETRVVKAPSSYQQKARASDVAAAAPLAEGQTWTFVARLLDVNGRPLGKDTLVTAEADLDDERERSDACQDQLDCVPSLRVRYGGRTDDPSQIIVSTPNFDTSREAATLSLTLIPDRSTGPKLSQEGAPDGTLLLPIDTSRVVFASDLSLVFPSGLSSGTVFEYEAKLTWYDRALQPIATAGQVFALTRKGGGWTWVTVAHDNSGIRIK